MSKASRLSAADGLAVSPLVTEEVVASSSNINGGADTQDAHASTRPHITIHHHHVPRTPPASDAHMKAQMAVWSPSDNTPNSRLMRNTQGNLRKALGKSLAHNLANRFGGAAGNFDGDDDANSLILPRPRFDECDAPSSSSQTIPSTAVKQTEISEPDKIAVKANLERANIDTGGGDTTADSRVNNSISTPSAVLSKK